jgi:hypothetical protein
MAGIGARIDETGTLVRSGDGFALRRDCGGRYELDLHRAPVCDAQRRVRIVGTLVAAGLVDVDLVSAA